MQMRYRILGVLLLVVCGFAGWTEYFMEKGTPTHPATLPEMGVAAVILLTGVFGGILIWKGKALFDQS